MAVLVALLLQLSPITLKAAREKTWKQFKLQASHGRWYSITSTGHHTPIILTLGSQTGQNTILSLAAPAHRLQHIKPLRSIAQQVATIHLLDSSHRDMAENRRAAY
ncbi:hypothetical protein B0T25DRAFT_291322 [Lasiosphaeria hispida]|uniref:Uncharacterized protein n=1 Tax=Lasiosphaeria hispida TaxID=260671 RepID=A0AAJ0MB40_9PEZI|nr:hypothetical protein B0T25DRAFT_291322 [Lasiosphaeria hispida]